MTGPSSQWWHELGACPACGGAVSAGGDPEGACAHCGKMWRDRQSIRNWRDDVASAEERHLPNEWAAGRRATGASRVVFQGKRALWQVFKLAGLPIRVMLQRKVGAFERRSVSDRALAEAWRDHYLKGLALPREPIWFEHSYRKIEKLGFARLLGHRITIQDIRSQSYWEQFPEAWCQVVPPSASHLPVRTSAADVAFTDGAIFDFDGAELAQFFVECFRILKPGGHLIIWAGNSQSPSRAMSEVRWHGRIHSLGTVREAVAGAGFVEIDQSFEGFAPPFLPTVINTIRHALAPWPFTTFDYDSWLGRWQQPQRRGYWLLRVAKPAAAAGDGPSHR